MRLKKYKTKYLTREELLVSFIIGTATDKIISPKKHLPNNYYPQFLTMYFSYDNIKNPLNKNNNNDVKKEPLDTEVKKKVSNQKNCFFNQPVGETSDNNNENLTNSNSYI